jgi:chitin disaccharide deacetylase
MKQLVVTADDFGMSREINEGIKKGIRAGVITNVSIMVNMPYFDDAIRFLKKYPSVLVGLHFNITEGSTKTPHNKIKTLLREDGNFYNWKEGGIRLLTQTFFIDEIKLELNHQFNKLKRTGVNINHIDSHHHIHLYPAIFKEFIKLAKHKNIQVLRCRTFDIKRIFFSFKNKPTIKEVFISLLCFIDSFLFNHLKDIHEIKGLYDLNWGVDLKGKKILNVLQNLPDGLTEIICHPAILSKEGNPNFLIPRYRNLCLLLSPKIKKIIKAKI